MLMTLFIYCTFLCFVFVPVEPLFSDGTVLLLWSVSYSHWPVSKCTTFEPIVFYEIRQIIAIFTNVVCQCQSLHCFCSHFLNKQAVSHGLFCWKCSHTYQHVRTVNTRLIKVNTAGDQTKSNEGIKLHTGLQCKSY